jgi:DHA1 family tetracycline resistance protein-like MFS transporter
MDIRGLVVTFGLVTLAQMMLQHHLGAVHHFRFDWTPGQNGARCSASA